MRVAVIFAGKIATIDGLRVGDSEENINNLRNAHPDRFFLRTPREAGSDRTESHQYLHTAVPFVFENGAFQNKWKYEINYLTMNGKIVEIRAGLSPDAGYEDIGASFR